MSEIHLVREPQHVMASGLTDRAVRIAVESGRRTHLKFLLYPDEVVVRVETQGSSITWVEFDTPGFEGFADGRHADWTRKPFLEFLVGYYAATAVSAPR